MEHHFVFSKSCTTVPNSYPYSHLVISEPSTGHFMGISWGRPAGFRTDGECISDPPRRSDLSMRPVLFYISPMGQHKFRALILWSAPWKFKGPKPLKLRSFLWAQHCIETPKTNLVVGSSIFKCQLSCPLCCLFDLCWEYVCKDNMAVLVFYLCSHRYFPFPKKHAGWCPP